MKQRQASDMEDLNVHDLGKPELDNEFRICTCNVRKLNRLHAAEQLVDILDKYKADITAIQEVRWDREIIRKMRNCYIYHGKCLKDQKQRLFKCSFLIRGRLRQEVISFNDISEHL